MTANNMHILTAQEFIAQGTSAGAIMSIAAAQSDQYARASLEAEARDVARITGQSLNIPGAVTAAREAARRAANDNRRGRRAA
ncbi:MAG: hypothetical protein H5U22_06710 [Rhizobium sp.]|nr:hypothetical protein [Rhizobium sp.]